MWRLTRVQNNPNLTDAELIDLLDQLIEVAGVETDPGSRLNALQYIALIVNKFMSQEGLNTVEQRLWNTSNGLLSTQQTSTSAIRTAFWITKGLIFRLVNIQKLVIQLLDRVSDETHGMTVALGFELLLGPDEILAKENNVTLRRLAPQKVFDLSLTEIKSRLRDTPATIKPNYIIALSGILKYLNPDIVTPQADAVMPLLLQALDVPNHSVKGAAIQTISTLAKSNPDAVKSHAPSLITRLLAAATGPDGVDAAVSTDPNALLD